MSQSDKSFFESIGVLKPKKAKSYNLVYLVGGVNQPVMGPAPYGLCASKKKELESETQYKTGSLIINPIY